MHKQDIEKFHKRCERLIEDLRGECLQAMQDMALQPATRDVTDPCGDKYRAKVTALTAFIESVDATEVKRQASMDADLAYEQCVDQHGPTTGMPDDTADGGDGVDTVPDMPSDDTIDGGDGMGTIEK